MSTQNPRIADTRCPCMSGLTLDECCGPILAGRRRAGTAEALMRSRFTAFAVGDAEYLLVSWHPDTRPVELELDESMRWYRLDVESTSGGSPFDSVGEVTFTAFYHRDTTRGTAHESSRFEKVDGDWKYVDGTVGWAS